MLFGKTTTNKTITNPKYNMVKTLCMLTPESYSQGERKGKKVMIEKKQNKTPRQVLDSIPNEILEVIYDQWYLDTFLKNCARVLYNRLVSGFAKFNKVGLCVGDIKRELLDEFFTQYTFKYKSRKIRNTKYRAYYYTFDAETGLPDLLHQYRTREEDVTSDVKLVSTYVALTFVCTNRDDRVHVYYNQLTYQDRNSIRIVSV